MIFIPLSLLATDACEIFIEIVDNSTKLEEYNLDIPEEIKGKIHPCIWGDGDFIKAFNLTSSIEEFVNMSNSFMEFSFLDETLPNSSVVANDTLKQIKEM